ncbi:MAG: hypothetical protein PHD81_02090 [Candidatus Nanoarchaeia archaeon]|nr:hypothetical protein [Candidatus Nanoarchaeia archaeon]MDD5587880.1 hypothetical protein [Candidatus Nanoarchaeia archaeon]
MKLNVFTNLDELVLHLKEESPKENYKVEVGLRPSGIIHLGNMITLAYAAWLVNSLGTHKSKLNVTICDIDAQGVDGNTLKTYNHLPDAYECHETFADHSTANIKDYVSLLSEELGVEFTFSKLSDIQKNESYRWGIERLLSDPTHLKEILGMDNLKHGKVPVFPICPTCKTATKSFSDYDNISKKIKSHCKQCDEDREYYLFDPNIELPVHFLIDPIRDGLVEPLSDVHVFGGDYNELHGQNQIKKVDKIKMFNEAACLFNKTIGTKYLVGPLFYSEDGSKMSKSNLNGLSLDKLKEHFRGLSGKEWIKHIIGFSRYLIKNNVTHTDYSITKNELLGGSFTQKY